MALSLWSIKKTPFLLKITLVGMFPLYETYCKYNLLRLRSFFNIYTFILLLDLFLIVVYLGQVAEIQ